MSIGVWQLLLVVIIIFVIFGAGKLPKVMGELGKGVKSLREGLKSDNPEDEKNKVSDKNIE